MCAEDPIPTLPSEAIRIFSPLPFANISGNELLFVPIIQFSVFWKSNIPNPAFETPNDVPVAVFPYCLNKVPDQLVVPAPGLVTST